MIEKDTIKLLRECDAGVKMGIDSIEDVLSHVRSDRLEQCLTDNKNEHEKLGREIQELLDRYHDEGKEPPAMASLMSDMKTKMMLAIRESDAEIANLMTDGCNMGIKSINRYCNQYKAADERSKGIAKRIIGTEERLAFDLRGFL